MYFQRCVAMGLSLLLSLAVTSRASAQTTEDVVRALGERGKGITTLHVEWQGQAFVLPDAEALQAGAGGFTFPTVGRLDYDQSGRYRLDYTDAAWNEQHQKMVSFEHSAAFDGERRTMLSGQDPFGFPIFSKKLKQASRRFTSDAKMLRLRGINLAYRPLDPNFGLCKAADAGAELEHGTIDGQEHLIVWFKNAQIWVDPARDLLPVRYHSYTNGQLQISVDVQYVNLKGAWQPASWSIQMFGAPGVVLRSYTETVTSYDTNAPIDAAVFTLSPPRGAYGIDHNQKERYLIRSNGEKRVLQPGEFSSDKYHLLLYDHYWWPTVITIAFVIIVFIASVLFYLRVNRRAVR